MSFRVPMSRKATDVQWLGEVPSHWEVERLKFSIRLISDPADTKTRPIALENIEGWSGRLVDTDSEFEGDGIAFQTGDILFGKLRPYLAKVHVAEAAGEAVGDFHVMRPSDAIDSRYAFYQIVRREVISIIDGSTQGAKMPRVSWDFMANLPLLLPPLAEQKAIAAFLDRETSKIDVLIAEQERLIALLVEKRQAVISHAVTKGLAPNAPKKDSGIDWLGEIPCGWDLVRLKFIAQVQGGVAKGRDLDDNPKILVPYLRVANVQDGYLDLEEIAEIEIYAHELARYSLRPGDVLMNEGGDFDKLGRGHIWRGEIDPCIHQNHVFAVRLSDVEPEWINLITTAAYGRYYFMSRSKQSTNLASISSSNIQELPVILPNRSDRMKIIEHVARETAKIDELTTNVRSGIALLRERRSALISAAVTGKIDVRGLADTAEAA